MNPTPRTFRLAAAIASVAITYLQLSTIFALAEPPVASALLAKAAPTAIVR